MELSFSVTQVIIQNDFNDVIVSRLRGVNRRTFSAYNSC